MKKISYLMILFISFFLFTLNTYALENIDLHSPNYIIYDMTDDNIITNTDLDKRINIASLTKIMTTITAIENINDLEKKITITDEMLSNIKWDASMAGLKSGDIVTLRDLLYASMLPSGADATQALAYSLSGGISPFVREMNNLAKKIGMNNTNFVNTTGLDIDNHYSTLNDLLTLLKYALNNKLFKEIYQTREYILTNNLKVDSTVNLYNRKLNYDTSRILGSKTGFTNKAGTCISFIFKSNEHDFIAITTGAQQNQGAPYNLLDALDIIKYMDKNYGYQTIIKKNEVQKKIKVNLSKIDEYAIKSQDNILLYLPNDYDKNKITIEYDGLKEIDFKTKVGTKLGTVKYYYDGELLKSEEVTLEESIKMDLIKVLIKYKVFVIISIVIIIFVIYTLRRRHINHLKRKKRKNSM